MVILKNKQAYVLNYLSKFPWINAYTDFFFNSWHCMQKKFYFLIQKKHSLPVWTIEDIWNWELVKWISRYLGNIYMSFKIVNGQQNAETNYCTDSKEAKAVWNQNSMIRLIRIQRLNGLKFVTLLLSHNFNCIYKSEAYELKENYPHLVLRYWWEKV